MQNAGTDKSSNGDRPVASRSVLTERTIGRDDTQLQLVTEDGSEDSSALPPLDALVPRIFEELRDLARRQLSREHDRFTLQTTDLVHEAYLRLSNDKRVTTRGRPYFYAAASRAMRQVLIDAARGRGAAKRGAGASPITLDDQTAAVDAYGDELIELDVALIELEKKHPRHARVVECRFFGGMTVEDVAKSLDISPRTVKSDWAFARAWLYEFLHGGEA